MSRAMFLAISGTSGANSSDIRLGSSFMNTSCTSMSLSVTMDTMS